MNEIKIAHLILDDVERIAELEAQLFSDGWGEFSVMACIVREDCVFLTLKEGDELCAYMCTDFAADSGYIAKVACVPEHRRKGYAARLLKENEDLCREKGISELSLEVRASNIGAQKLYESAGFTFAGKRPNVYDHPSEDAMVYIKAL